MISQRGERNAESVSDLAIVPSRDDKQDDLLLAHRQAAFRHELGSGVVPPLDALSRCLLFEQRSEFQRDVGASIERIASDLASKSPSSFALNIDIFR